MNGIRKIIYYALILGLCLSGPALLLLWTHWIEPHWGTVDVVRAVKPIERGERLTEQMVRTEKIRKDTVVGGAISQLTEVMGQEVTRSVRVGEQLTPEMVDTRHLQPGMGEWNMPLPSEWIFGKPPGSLLRGDRITLLPISKEDAKRLEASPLEPSVSPEEETKLQNIVVSYAKGTNNQEIASSEDRKKPSGAVTTVELIVNEEQKELIRKYGMKGYRFLLVYR